MQSGLRVKRSALVEALLERFPLLPIDPATATRNLGFGKESELRSPDHAIHFNPRSRAALFQKMSSTWVSLRRSDQQAHLSDRKCSRPVSTGLSCW